jgi:hypothetical protein
MIKFIVVQIQTQTDGTITMKRVSPTLTSYEHAETWISFIHFEGWFQIEKIFVKKSQSSSHDKENTLQEEVDRLTFSNNILKKGMLFSPEEKEMFNDLQTQINLLKKDLENFIDYSKK